MSEDFYSNWEDYFLDCCRFGDIEGIKECFENKVDV